MRATVQLRNFLSSRLLFKNVKIKIYKTTVLPVVFYGCETVVENGVLRRTSGPKRDEIIVTRKKTA
jgi:hypothetical protein